MKTHDWSTALQNRKGPIQDHRGVSLRVAQRSNLHFFYGVLKEIPFQNSGASGPLRSARAFEKSGGGWNMAFASAWKPCHGPQVRGHTRARGERSKAQGRSRMKRWPEHGFAS
eukprot:scaffold3825_cov225-Pinguiococcus_pyrenoidosus.AAC.1